MGEEPQYGLSWLMSEGSSKDVVHLERGRSEAVLGRGMCGLLVGGRDYKDGGSVDVDTFVGC